MDTGCPFRYEERNQTITIHPLANDSRRIKADIRPLMVAEAENFKY